MCIYFGEIFSSARGRYDPFNKICEPSRPANRWPVALSSDAHCSYALRHRGCWQRSIPSAFAPNPSDPPAPPASDC